MSLVNIVYLCFLNFWMCVQELFDFSGVDVFSSSDDQVLYASFYFAVSVPVQTGNVPVSDHRTD